MKELSTETLIREVEGRTITAQGLVDEIKKQSPSSKVSVAAVHYAFKKSSDLTKMELHCSILILRDEKLDKFKAKYLGESTTFRETSSF